MKTEYSNLSRFVTMLVSQLGDSLRDQAEACGMSHTTLSRRMSSPGEFTLDEVAALIDAVRRRAKSPERRAVRYELLGRSVVGE
jgi:hypothetical protein